MSDHLVLCADHLVTSASLESMRHFGEGTSTYSVEQYHAENWDLEAFTYSDEEGGGEKFECRICQDEGFIKELEAPCACHGSLKFAHTKCIQRWCNEKMNTICEICRQPYQPGYTAPTSLPHCDDTALDIRDGPVVPGSPREIRSPGVVAASASTDNLLEGEYDECATARGAKTAIFRSIVLILMAILMMRHAFSLVEEEDSDMYNLLSTFLLRILAFLMPVYIMAWIVTVLLRRVQRHEAGGLGSTEDSTHES
ncbi:putative E3 ubiquitin ligase SUD1 [Camellia lanceoleosa]|uniref:E3 ubiquitin ligase SUD1 n=1 Tax=Camellia lanceoleosa TaxID=1840588 RepID=A0ACC0IXW0_9ERIC|nr:putative E3 ubiquitin ligase SUD1 [Camellia lanceoleosa]